MRRASRVSREDSLTRSKLCSRLAAVLLLLLGAQHIGMVLCVYLRGARMLAQDAGYQIFTRAGALKAFSAALPLHALLIAALLMARFAGESEKTPLRPDPRFLNRMLTGHAAALPGEVLALRTRRSREKALWLTLALLACAPGLIYLLRYSAPGDAEEALSRLLLRVLPWAALSIALLLVSDAREESALENENRLLLQLKKGEARALPSRAVPWYVYALIYLLAALLIALGVGNGGLRDVLVKAINICTECIGLG